MGVDVREDLILTKDLIEGLGFKIFDPPAMIWQLDYSDDFIITRNEDKTGFKAGINGASLFDVKTLFQFENLWGFYNSLNIPWKKI